MSGASFKSTDIDANHDVSLENIKASHALSGDVSALDAYYQDWAETYDADVSAEGYVGPAFTAHLAAAAVADAGMEPSDVTVLDAGCGTGLVGAELARSGFGAVDGVDLSRPMVEKAQATGFYRNLVGGVDLSEPIDCVEDEHYDLVTCCGVFTVGHVEAEALDHIVAPARAGAFLVISTRNSYLRESRFTQHVDELVGDGKLELLKADDDGPYIDEEGATYWVLRK
ncbi:class I SAM-dependent methyltransferase [Actinomadura sp. KC06]|uniref:class I SAM-dependent DNA methyltransferase n=1 Tax=Actinomadura sp. KC06 TaxID=2530369 RepID=UPI0010499984|nr:class I SAM-dependent methyltransferase [Actinomadura sp. KC06]TDD37275.1 class I SAM-dependent methyltransferase [Actinomadura sp. KC06]